MGKMVIHKARGMIAIFTVPSEGQGSKLTRIRANKVADKFKAKGFTVSVKDAPYKGDYYTFIAEHNKRVVASTVVWESEPADRDPFPGGA